MYRYLTIVLLLWSVSTWAQSPTPTPCTFTVNVTSDGSDNGSNTCNDGSGNCTFRAAIQSVNALACTNSVIRFGVSGAGCSGNTCTITLGSVLPIITPDHVLIDGTTQTGASCGDLWHTSGGTPIPTPPVFNIVVDCNGLASGEGVRIEGTGSIIQGLEVKNTDLAISGIGLEGASQQARCNYVHNTRDMTVGSGTGNVVGGPNAGDGNLLNANLFAGVVDRGANGCVIERNFVGVDATGFGSAPNIGVGPGIGIEGPGINAAVVRHNLVGNNNGTGVSVGSGDTNTVVDENIIGFAIDGMTFACNCNEVFVDTPQCTNWQPQYLDNGTGTTGSNTVNGACVGPTPTPTPPATPTPGHECCQFADGTSIGHPGSTCIDDVILNPDSVTSLGGCDAVNTGLSLGGTTASNPNVNCSVPGDLGSVCNTPSATTPTSTPTDTPTITRTPTVSSRVTPTLSPRHVSASHIHALELTEFNGVFGYPLYSDICQQLKNSGQYPPHQEDICRCVLAVRRTGGVDSLTYMCSDGVLHTIGE